MTKLGESPTRRARSRRMRTQVEWKVAMRGGRMPAGRTRSSTRRRISSAALFVKVTASTWRGCTPSTPKSQAMRCAMTRVLPLPAPARTRTGPVVACTACCWTGLSEARMLSGATAGRCMGSYDITRRRPRGRTRALLLDGDGLREVSRLVHVAPEAHRHVIREELQRQGHEDGRKQLRGGGHRHHARGAGADLPISLVGQRDDVAVARPHLLHGVHHALVGGVARGEGNDGHTLVDQGDGTVLHLARGVAFGVQIRQLLELEGALEGEGIVKAPAQEEEVLVGGHLLGELRD